MASLRFGDGLRFTMPSFTPSPNPNKTIQTDGLAAAD